MVTTNGINTSPPGPGQVSGVNAGVPQIERPPQVPQTPPTRLQSDAVQISPQARQAQQNQGNDQAGGPTEVGARAISEGIRDRGIENVRPDNGLPTGDRTEISNEARQAFEAFGV